MSYQSLGTIREFETKNFRVVIDALEEYEDLSWDEDHSVRQGLENGSLVCFCARAFVEFKPTGEILGSDYLGQCIYSSYEDFEDHRTCGIANRKRIKQEGKFQIYRTRRPNRYVLDPKDKLKKRGLATYEKAEAWAKANAKEPWQIVETALCGSAFVSIVYEAIKAARQTMARNPERYQ